ncbi:Folic acid synthesis protein fol1-like protein 2 [Colletotrichum chlorophyti]|uniref:dihydroneopterin aldolase n=1 Tax=Colletotrichum chlorophyti TaxID=708187 RepID=A0A1Q8S0V0_9PEZI|nr:Folic acid synthesis protein fol1-like protein 2 [Colletotrichum chlorophyti]
MPDPPKLVSSWHVRALAGEPFAVIRVRDLQSTICAGSDAWGRTFKPQPVVISATLSMATPFDAASASDTVADDTVHYGLLAKAILAGLERVNGGNLSLSAAMRSLWAHLTGFVAGEDGWKSEGREGTLLGRKGIRYLGLEVTLPKASLLGSGVSLSWDAVFGEDSAAIAAWSSCLKIRELRVPTLIGVNDNERTARQVVVADVEIEGYRGTRHDIYVGIESIIVKTLEQSSFETLEALGPAITSSIRRDFKDSQAQEPHDVSAWAIKVALEKPTAITFAAASRVEYRETSQGGRS